MADITSSTDTSLSPALKRELANLKGEVEKLSTPDGVAQNLMRAFATRAAHTQRTSRGWFAKISQWLAPGAALAASLGMALWVAIGTIMLPPISERSTLFNDADAPFIALQSLERIALEPSPHLVETVLPRMLLTSYGVTVSPETAGDQVHAQMLVSAAGQPLALRFAP
jgi:hypothetical protein